MPTDEAIDLVGTLPQGSAYVAATDPARSWGEQRHLAADIVDAVAAVAWALGAFDRESHPQPPKVTRPQDLTERARAASNAGKVRSALESGEWEAV